jgi:formamidopyrimidine-DNA glycosylase
MRKPWDVSWPELLADRRINAINRRGKWILFSLDDSSFLVVHLGMTGQLTVVAADLPRPDHLHVVFTLEDGQELRFRDTRRFGSVTRIANQTDLDLLFTENGLGPEPFDLDPAAWRASLASTQQAIKATLLDQTVVAGVGNIYADEILFQARIHPKRPSCTLTSAEADELRKAIPEVLNQAINSRGSTIRDYIGGSGLRGGFQDQFRVYGRTGEPCPRCQTPIATLRIAGRTSHYCPRCQPARKEPASKGRKKIRPAGRGRKANNPDR